MINVEISEAALARVGGAHFDEEDLLPGIGVRPLEIDGEYVRALGDHGTGKPSKVRGKAVGVLKGRQIMPWELAKLSHDAGWTSDERLVEAVSIWLAESQGYAEAENRNYDMNGKLLSIDVGCCQINIPASQDNSDEYRMLLTPAYCMERARQLYEAHGWQPWVAHNTGVAHDVNWWHWSDMKHAWVPTGRYPHRALRGVCNFRARLMGIHAESNDKGVQLPFVDFHGIPAKPTFTPGP